MNQARQLLPVVGVTLGLAFGSASASNAVTDWHTNMESAVVATGKKSPTDAFVYFAYADVAMYDAVNSIDRRFQPFAVQVYAPRSAGHPDAADARPRKMAAGTKLSFSQPAHATPRCGMAGAVQAVCAAQR